MSVIRDTFCRFFLFIFSLPPPLLPPPPPHSSLFYFIFLTAFFCRSIKTIIISLMSANWMRFTFALTVPLYDSSEKKAEGKCLLAKVNFIQDKVLIGRKLFSVGFFRFFFFFFVSFYMSNVSSIPSLRRLISWRQKKKKKLNWKFVILKLLLELFLFNSTNVLRSTN